MNESNIADVLPLVLPANWSVVEGNDFMRRYQVGPLHVIASVANHGPDNKEWIHISLSRESFLPSWEEYTTVKDTLIPKLTALQILPPRERWVNIHRYCLHMWACLDGDVVPDFAGEALREFGRLSI